VSSTVRLYHIGSLDPLVSRVFNIMSRNGMFADRLDADGTMEAYARYFSGRAAFMLVNIALITSPARIGGSAAMPRKIAVASRQ
jgi:hypothetical protein